MHYKAVVSKQYPMADEALRVIIADTDTFDTFKQRVFDVLKISDQRAHNHMQWLLEDTNLTKELGYIELRATKEAFRLLFPSEGIPAKLDLGEETAFEFSKIMANGEDLKVFIHGVESYEELGQAIKQVWDIIDSRLKRTNDRDIKFKEFVSKFPFDFRMKITTIFQLLYGKEIEDVAKVLRDIREGKSLETDQQGELNNA